MEGFHRNHNQNYIYWQTQHVVGKMHVMDGICRFIFVNAPPWNIINIIIFFTKNIFDKIQVNANMKIVYFLVIH